MVTPSTLFEEFGFNYIGPIGGHDLDGLVPTLENISKPRTQFLHVITRKGRGHKLAERIRLYTVRASSTWRKGSSTRWPPSLPTARFSATGCA